MLPTLFLSHGAPDLPLIDVAARRFLMGLGRGLERPRAVLVASAHWETAAPTLNAIEGPNPTIHDFGDFGPRMREARYPAPGAAGLAGRAVEWLAAEGLAGGLDRERGLDHGAWVPLSLMYPAADLPVVQLSVQPALGPDHHLALGRALAGLRQEGVLVVGSGCYTHDLSAFRQYWGRPNAAEPAWVRAFADWFDAALVEGREDDLLAYRRRAPHAERNHPTEEHLLPLFVALGAAGAGARAERLHASTTYGVLRMDAYAFH